MLNVFRENLRHLKWILLLVVFSFILTIYAVWGGGISRRESSTQDAAQPWAARVDGEVIGIQEFQNEARNLDSTYRQLLGGQYEQQRTFLRIGQTAIDRLINESLLEKEAHRAGLTVSEQEVAEAIVKDPSLQQNGAFIGKERYEKLYRSNPVMFENYEATVRRQLLQDKVRSLLEDSVTVTDSEIEEAFRRQNEKASFEYVLIDAARLPSATPSDAALQDYYRAHAGDYQSPEGRSGRYVLFATKEIAAKIDVPESEIRSQFLQDQKTVYSTPEKRRASHILVKVASDASPGVLAAAQEKIQKALKRVASEDFAKVAREVSEDSTASSGGDLGYFTRDQMVRDFSDAAWALAVGQTSPVVRTPFGLHVIKLTDIQAARELSLDEARPQVLAALQAARARDEANRRAADLAGKVKSAGGDLAKAARDGSLAVKEFQGVHPGEPMADLGVQPVVASVLFSLKSGETSAPIPVSSGVVVVQFLSTTPPAALPFDKVRDRVAADALRQDRLSAASKMLAAAGGSASLEATAKRLKTEVKKTGPVSASGPAGDLGSDPAVLKDIFALKVGETSRPVAIPSGSVAVVKLVERPDPMQGFDAQKGSLRKSLLATKRDRLFRAYLDRLRAAHPAEINTQLIEQIDRT